MAKVPVDLTQPLPPAGGAIVRLADGVQPTGTDWDAVDRADEEMS